MIEFARNHIVASLIGAIGIILAALGYADQAGAIATTYKPWQLQALGAALFVVFVIKVLVSYDKTQSQKNRWRLRLQILQTLKRLLVR